MHFNAMGQIMDNNIVEYKNNVFYHFTNDENDKLIIFLHGGVINPYFKQEYKNIKLSYLLEGSDIFIEKSLKNNFDILIPITNDSLNWLINPQQCFDTFKKFITTNDKKYSEIYISGFSDGGTGSFKIFYLNPTYFNGVIVFNGYPQHRHFSSKVDYSLTTNKKVLFFGTTEDKVIPYEFLLTEYCKQKVSNSDTYFYLTEGNHSFTTYGEKEISIVYDIINTKKDNTQNTAIHGFIRNDSVLNFYKFRRMIVNQYGHGKEFFKINKQQKKIYKNKQIKSFSN